MRALQVYVGTTGRTGSSKMAAYSMAVIQLRRAIIYSNDFHVDSHAIMNLPHCLRAGKGAFMWKVVLHIRQTLIHLHVAKMGER